MHLSGIAGEGKGGERDEGEERRTEASLPPRTPPRLGGAGTPKPGVRCLRSEAPRYDPPAGQRRLPRPGLDLFSSPESSSADPRWVRLVDMCSDYSLRLHPHPEAHEITLDLTSVERLFGSTAEVGRDLRNRIRGEMGLEVALGIGPTATVAELAGRGARAGDIVDVPARRAVEFIAQLPITLLPGVHAAWARWLRDMKIQTAGDLAALSADSVTRTFGERGLRLWEIAAWR